MAFHADGWYCQPVESFFFFLLCDGHRVQHFQETWKMHFYCSFSWMETLYKVVLFLKLLDVLNEALFFSISKGSDAPIMLA